MVALAARPPEPRREMLRARLRLPHYTPACEVNHTLCAPRRRRAASRAGGRPDVDMRQKERIKPVLIHGQSRFQLGF